MCIFQRDAARTSSLPHAEIPKRRYKLSSYGLAFAKQTARLRGVNPVWYVDITPRIPRQDWLMVPVNKMIEKEIKRHKKFRNSPLALFAPFIESSRSHLSPVCRDFSHRSQCVAVA